MDNQKLSYRVFKTDRKKYYNALWKEHFQLLCGEQGRKGKHMYNTTRGEDDDSCIMTEEMREALKRYIMERLLDTKV